MVQPLAPTYQDHCVAGFMNPHVDCTNIASSSGTNIPGANQADQMAVQHEDQYLDHCVAGFMNGSHVDCTNIASSSGTNIWGANQADHMAVQDEEQYLAHNIAGFMNGSQLDYTTNPVPNSERNIPVANHADQWAVQHERQYIAHNVGGFMNCTQVDYSNNPVSNSELHCETQHFEFEQQLTSYGQPSTVSSCEVLPLLISENEVCHPEFPENNSMFEASYSQSFVPSLEVPPQIASLGEHCLPLVFSENNSGFEFGGQHSHTDEMFMERDYYNTLTGNINIYANFPIQDATTNDNEPPLEPYSSSLSELERYWTATAHDHTQDGH